MAHNIRRDLDADLGNYNPQRTKYRGTIAESVYITMRDGVRLAVEVVLPKNIVPDDKIPALISQTRYWRSMELNAPFKWFLKSDMLNPYTRGFQPFFTSHGYALVLVDVRGTGASYGTWPYPWSEESILDATEIINWIVSQPWSNGNVGGYGVSYLGTTAELLAISNHPAMKATIPMFNHPDGYIDVAFPGGIYNQRFIRAWANFDSMLDQNVVPKEFSLLGRMIIKGVKPVDEDKDRQRLKNAVHEHSNNGDVHKLALSVDFRDQPPSGESLTIEDLTVHKHKAEIENSNTVSCGWGSWLDAGTADAVIRRFVTFANNQRAVIGAWEHGGRLQASPYQPPDKSAYPTLQEQWNEMLRFFDAYLMEIDNGVRGEKVLFYYTMGEEKWKKTHVWPPEGVDNQRWYMASDKTLSVKKPEVASGFDSYNIEFEVSTGDYNRWWELGPLDFKTVIYPDMRESDRRMLTYTSPTLEQDIEITGHPIVTLYVTSSESDGAFYVYLEDVHEDRQVTYITEGQLRAIHRKISTENPPYNLAVPYHTFKEGDALPLVPGEVSEITFGLHPTSVLIRKGHRIRVGIAGHDQGTFARIPAEGTPVITVERNRVHASYIDLPVTRRM